MALIFWRQTDSGETEKQVSEDWALPVSLYIGEAGSGQTESVGDARPMPVTAGTSEQHIGQVGGNSVLISQTVTLVAASDYTALDVLSNSVLNPGAQPILFAGASRRAGGSGYIVKALLTNSVDTNTTWQLRLHLFRRNDLTSELRDNIAFSLTAVDRLKRVGVIDFPVFRDDGAVSVSDNADVRLKFVCDPLDTSLYGILQAIAIGTDESAGQTISVELTIEQD